MKGPRKMHLKQTVSPFTLDYDLWEALETFRTRTGKSRSSLLEKAVCLLLEAEGVIPGRGNRIEPVGDDPAAIEAKAKADEEKARLKAEQEAAAAREKLAWSWARNAEYNEHCKRQGIMPLGREHYLPTDAQEQAAEDARKAAEKATREAFV